MKDKNICLNCIWSRLITRSYYQKGYKCYRYSDKQKLIKPTDTCIHFQGLNK